MRVRGQDSLYVDCAEAGAECGERETAFLDRKPAMRKQLIEEMQADGWTLTSDNRFLQYQYVLIFMSPQEG